MFEHGTYWKEFEQTGPDIDDSIINVEGFSFIVPTTTIEEDAAVFADCPKKRNYNEVFDRAPFTVPQLLLPDRNTNDKCKRESGSDNYIVYIYKSSDRRDGN